MIYLSNVAHAIATQGAYGPKEYDPFIIFVLFPVAIAVLIFIVIYFDLWPPKDL